MKAAIYSPYLDTLGGGEKYMMSIAQALNGRYSVDVLLDLHLIKFGAEKLKKDLETRFDVQLKNVNFIKGPLGKNSNFISRLLFLQSYDLFFYLTDGSIFYPSAKKNILHIQSPILGQPAKSLWGKFKLSGWDKIIYNSEFTKKYSEKNWPISSVVIYPPVDVDKIKPKLKRNYILSVGRFFGYLRDKKHEIMINIFKDLYRQKKIPGWSLHLVGSASQGDYSYIKQLKKKAENLPINFYPNLKYDQLISLYGQSSIYWHAAGYGEDDPTKMEHFGISTVEAMSGGCVPVVIAKGGQVEIIDEGKNGFVWHTIKECKSKTLMLISDKKLREDLSQAAKKRAKFYSKEKFDSNLNRLLKS